MNIPEIVIIQTKEILESTRENLNNYEFYPVCNKVIMEKIT